MVVVITVAVIRHGNEVGMGMGIVSPIPYPDSPTYPRTHTRYPTGLSLLSHPGPELEPAPSLKIFRIFA